MTIGNDLYYAALYAAELEREGKPRGLANYIAGNKYFYNASSVAKARIYLKNIWLELMKIYDYSSWFWWNTNQRR